MIPGRVAWERLPPMPFTAPTTKQAYKPPNDAYYG